MVNFHCVAEGCNNDSRKISMLSKYPNMVLNGKVVEFFVLPSVKRHPKLRKQWLFQIRREGFEPDSKGHWYALCSRHFVDGKPTEENPIPTLFAYNNYKMGNPRKTKNSILRSAEYVPRPSKVVTVSSSSVNKMLRRENLPHIPEITYTEQPSADHEYCCSFENAEIYSMEENCSKLIEDYNKLEEKWSGLQTDNLKLKEEIKYLIEDIQTTKEENKVLKSKLYNRDALFTEILIEKITKCDQNVKNFLGLPSIILLFGVFNLLKEPASRMKYWVGPGSADSKQWQERDNRKPGCSRKLNLFEEYLITLLRLRLGLDTYFLSQLFGVLSQLFGVAQSTVTRIYTSWISLMAQVLGPLIKWPSRKKNNKNMPLSFKRRFPNTCVIIDATEFFVQRPRNPTAQSKTWSNYKSKNTFKTLLGITPNGAFSFVSELWTGNISDRCITQKSGFLDLIEKGDDVMADRGFLIRDLLLLKGATLNMPPFTRPCKHGKGKCLTTKEIKQSKKIASLRIHVERAIQRLKTFKFLNGIISINSLSVVNQALKVAAVFCNLMKPLVRKV